MTSPILPGAEPASFSGGPTGVLVLHGFTGSPQSMRGIAERLAADGHTVELPLLPGHGTSVEDMVTTTVDDWLAAARSTLDGLAARTERQVVVGLSMGGTLTGLLAVERDLAGAVFINAAVASSGPEVAAGLQAMLDGGVEVFEGVGGDIAKEGVTELAYAGSPVRPLLSLLAKVDELAGRLDRITCPVLILTSPDDHVVPAAASDHLAASVGGPVERVTLERSYHVATLDHDAQLIEDSISRFVAGLAG